MAAKDIHIEIPDVLKYNHTVRKSPSSKAFSGHSHNLYEIIYIINGDASYIIEGKKYKLKSGDLIITRPRKYHLIQISRPDSHGLWLSGLFCLDVCFRRGRHTPRVLPFYAHSVLDVML